MSEWPIAINFTFPETLKPVVPKVITLVCTVHAARGKANASELLAILERIQPEVIFLEFPPDAMDLFINKGAMGDLESAAVRRYCEDRSVGLVPVDITPPDQEFFDDYQRVQKMVDNISRDSRRLMTWHNNYVYDHGFAYLNSEYGNKMFSEIASDELNTLQALEDSSLLKIAEQWQRTNSLRESEMMKKIDQYCRDTAFGRGAFLIGAGHRQSIIEKSRQYFCDSHNVRWDFSCGQT